MDRAQNYVYPRKADHACGVHRHRPEAAGVEQDWGPELVREMTRQLCGFLGRSTARYESFQGNAIPLPRPFDTPRTSENPCR